MSIQELEARKRKVEEELKEIEAERRKAEAELAKQAEKKKMEEKKAEERKQKPARERPADWDKYVPVSARKQQVEVNGRKNVQFVTGLGSYARDIKLAISKFGEAVILARGVAISRAVDLSQHKSLEAEGIVIKDVKIGHEDIEREGRERRVAEIKIVLVKVGG